MDGDPYYRTPVIGYVRLNYDSLAYMVSEGSINKMEIDIAPKILLELEVVKAIDVPVILDETPLLIGTSNKYLLIRHRDPACRRR